MAADRDHEDSAMLKLLPCAGVSLIDGQIIFSYCSRYFACCWGQAVKVYNTTNGQCCQILEGHRDTVTGLAINPANKLQLFSCGLDGDIKQWMYIDGILLRTYSFYMPLHALVSVDPSATFVSAVVHRPQSTNCCLLRLPLSNKGSSASREAPIKTDIVLPECEADARKVSHGCKEQYIAAVQGSKLSVYSCKEKIFKRHTTNKKNPFTCVACHPTDCCLATGHANGMITLWKNFFNKEKTLQTVYHWHSLPVLCLAFSPEGSTLLSGGHECAMVRWQMNAEEKHTLPRLCGPIHTITPSPDGALCVTSHTNNVLTLVTSSSGIMHAMCGLGRGHTGVSGKLPMPVGLLYDPRSKTLVTNGRPGHLQFYCRNTDHQLYNLDITGQNYISPENLDKPTAVTEVEHAAFDPSGHWLATFQQWDDGVLSPEYCLKFWAYNNKKQNYQLNTTVETPHYQSVTCLKFRPQPDAHSSSSSSSPMMVSTGQDGFFKLWTLNTETLSGKTVTQWTCDFIGHYRKKPASLARFSRDGRKLAVVFSEAITLWDPDTNTLLDKSSFNQPIRCLEFADGGSSQFLVLTTSSHLTILDLDTLSVTMQIEMTEALLATDADLVCAISQQQVYMFRLSEDPPTLQKIPCPTPAIRAAFLPHNGKPQLYVLDSQQTLLTLGPEKEQASPRAQVQLNQQLPQTPFQALLKASHQNGNDTATTAPSSHHSGLIPKPLAGFDVMNERIITGESFSKKAQWMLETMLIRRKGLTETMEVEEEKEEEEEEDKDVDVEMDCS